MWHPCFCLGSVWENNLKQNFSSPTWSNLSSHSYIIQLQTHFCEIPFCICIVTWKLTMLLHRNLVNNQLAVGKIPHVQQGPSSCTPLFYPSLRRAWKNDICKFTEGNGKSWHKVDLSRPRYCLRHMKWWLEKYNLLYNKCPHFQNLSSI